MTAKAYIIIDTITTETELTTLLSNNSVPCVRLANKGDDPEDLRKKCDQFRLICHNLEVPFILEDNYEMAKSLGLDGVHLNRDNQDSENIIKMATDEFMIGVDCGHSRHAGLISAEMGASYISFKMPNNQSESESSIIETELFEWWHQTVEISLVAEGCNTLQQMSAVLKVSDFISISPTEWRNNKHFSKINHLLN